MGFTYSEKIYDDNSRYPELYWFFKKNDPNYRPLTEL